MNREELKSILPHREPMLLLDEADRNEDGTATAFYTVRGDEYFLQGHFPGNPIVPGVIQCEMMAQSAWIVPGVIQCEMMAQSACVLFADRMSDGALAVYTGIDKVRFRGMVKPGDRIRIDTREVRSCPPLFVVKSELSVDGKKCAGGELSFAIVNA